MANPYLAEIRIFAFNFAPQGWAFCNGQTLAINQYTAVFSLIGTYYGGNGTTTFQLPNLQSRVPIHQGQGYGLSPYVVGQNGGTETVTITVNQMPQHNHLITADGAQTDALGTKPAGRYLGSTIDDSGNVAIYSKVDPPTTPVTMAPSMVNLAGGSQPHPNIQPFLTLTFCIALVGIYPSRS